MLMSMTEIEPEPGYTGFSRGLKCRYLHSQAADQAGCSQELGQSQLHSTNESQFQVCDPWTLVGLSGCSGNASRSAGAVSSNSFNSPQHPRITLARGFCEKFKVWLDLVTLAAQSAMPGSGKLGNSRAGISSGSWHMPQNASCLDLTQ